MGDTAAMRRNKIKNMMKSNEGISTNVDLVERPVLKSYANESPEDRDEAKRLAFYRHKSHYFIFTTAGKPVFTKSLPVHYRLA